jgi:hypothetical protein
MRFAHSGWQAGRSRALPTFTQALRNRKAALSAKAGLIVINQTIARPSSAKSRRLSKGVEAEGRAPAYRVGTGFSPE